RATRRDGPAGGGRVGTRRRRGGGRGVRCRAERPGGEERRGLLPDDVPRRRLVLEPARSPHGHDVRDTGPAPDPPHGPPGEGGRVGPQLPPRRRASDRDGRARRAERGAARPIQLRPRRAAGRLHDAPRHRDGRLGLGRAGRAQERASGAAGQLRGGVSRHRPATLRAGVARGRHGDPAPADQPAGAGDRRGLSPGHRAREPLLPGAPGGAVRRRRALRRDARRRAAGAYGRMERGRRPAHVSLRRVVMAAQSVRVRAGAVTLDGDLSLPDGARAIVLFAHGSGSSRLSPRNRHVARLLNQAKLATLLVDLLTAEEEAVDQRTAQLRFNIGLLAERLVGVTDWLDEQPDTRPLRIGYFGASTGAAAALVAAAGRLELVHAIVSRGGRPDLAGPVLARVEAPTLLIVGGNDPVVIELNRAALAQLRCEKKLVIVPGATHLFEEPGALDEVARLARQWLERHLTREEQASATQSPFERGGETS